MLLGATGFTGQLVAEELARNRKPLRWAIAGRDPNKLRDVKSALVGISPENGAVGTILADTSDPASLRAMARQARIVVTTAGPYAERGIAVVEACVDEGAHYLDITGEPAFVSESRSRFDAPAAAKGLRIVHCCGFDSVPADLGALFTVCQLPPGVPKQVRCYVDVDATFSGGTWASFIGGLHRGDRSTKSDGARSDAKSDRRAPRQGIHRPPEGMRGVAIPLPVIDPVLVRRSARTMPERYGQDFEYGQFLVVPPVRAAQLAVGIAGLMAMARIGPTRRWLLSRRPSGEGPTAEQRARASFSLTFIGKAGEVQVKTRVSGGDPGYTETSRMVAALTTLLATRESELPKAAGVITPAVAFGEPGIAAVREAGLEFTVL